MGARRIGFGDDDHLPRRRQPSQDTEARRVAPATDDAAPDAKEMSWFGKMVLAAFLLAWLVGWSIALVEVAKFLPNSYARGDWFSVGFGVVWLTFGGLGWLFALVMLLAILFGKTRDPNKPGLLQRRKAMRRRAGRD